MLVLNTRRPLIHESIFIAVRFINVNEGLIYSLTISIFTSNNIIKPFLPRLQIF